jgi:hypothetical protein
MRSEIYFLLLIKMLLVLAGHHGELFHPSNRNAKLAKKNRFTWNSEIIWASFLNTSGPLNFKGVTGRWFLWGLERHWKCFKLIWVIKKCTTKLSKKNRNFRVFSIVAFFRFKNNVCFNKTTKTLKYHLDVSQLADKCFHGFLSGLLYEAFFSKFFLWVLKNIIFSKGRNLEKFWSEIHFWDIPEQFGALRLPLSGTKLSFRFFEKFGGIFSTTRLAESRIHFFLEISKTKSALSFDLEYSKPINVFDKFLDHTVFYKQKSNQVTTLNVSPSCLHPAWSA